jgi:tetratricopeptide (TPR) repeat protein
MSTQDVAVDPLFDPRPTPEADAVARLVRALELTEGFALMLCRAHPSQFAELMGAVEAALPGKRIQQIVCDTPRWNLLPLLANEVTSPPPDAVFVSGLERWLRAEMAARSLEAVSARFLFNLNAHRNDFAKYVHCPLVLWIPDHILLALQRYAPDFFSVHSVLIRFAPPDTRQPAALEQARDAADGLEQASLLSLTPPEREARMEELTQALGALRELPEAQRDAVLESNVLDRLAALHAGQGRYSQAEPLYREALDIRRAALPTDHPLIASSLNNLANVYESEGRYSEAEGLLADALAIRRIALPPSHPDIAASLNNLAVHYETQGRYAEAEPLYQEALGIRRAALPEGHPDIAASLNNIARLRVRQERLAEAEPLYAESLGIRRAALPEGHPDIAASLNNLATLYESQGRYSEAGPLYERASTAMERAVGGEHPDARIIARNVKRLADRLQAGSDESGSPGGPPSPAPDNRPASE